MMPLLCPERNLPCFCTAAECREWYGEMPAITVDKVYQCPDCEGFHAESHARGPAGGSSGTSRENNPIPQNIAEHNQRLSQRDAERYKQEGTEL